MSVRPAMSLGQDCWVIVTSAVAATGRALAAPRTQMSLLCPLRHPPPSTLCCPPLLAFTHISLCAHLPSPNSMGLRMVVDGVPSTFLTKILLSPWKNEPPMRRKKKRGGRGEPGAVVAASWPRGGGGASKVQLKTLHLPCNCHMTKAWRGGDTWNFCSYWEGIQPEGCGATGFSQT